MAAVASRAKRVSHRVSNTVGMVLAAAGAVAQAAEEGNESQLPKITVQEGELREVSSPKFTAPLVDTPQSVTIVPKEIFNQQGAQNLTDVLFNTPGITFNAGENGFATGLSNFSIRGFDTSGSVFVDGVRDSGNYNRDVFNLEQVEVVKGPAGDNGRGSAGGYVNLVTKTPYLENTIAGSASIAFDEYDGDENARVAFDVNQTFSESTALRLNLFVQDGGISGREVAQQDGWGVAPSLAFGLGTQTRFIAAYQHVEQDDVPDWGVPGAFIDGMIQHDPNLDADSLRDNFYGLSSDFDEVSTDSALVRIEHDFVSGLTLSNQTRWSQTEREALYTPPSGYAPATQLVATQRQAYQRDSESISNLTNMGLRFDTGSVGHNLSFGLELVREESAAQRFGTQNNPGTGTPISVLDPDANRGTVAPLAAVQTSDVKIDTVAGYVYDTLSFGEHWDVTGGVRVEHYKVEIDSSTVAGAPQGPDGYEVSETTVSGKLGLVYKPNSHASVYAAVGLAALPPGSFLSNPDISREGDNAFPGWSSGMNSEDSKVQESINYEIGTKWNFFEDKLATTAAAFYTERRNVGISGRDYRVTPLPPTELLGYGEQIVQGIELGIAGQITPAWSIFGGVAFMDSERKHSAFLDEARRLANPADYGTVTRTSGDELAFSPEVTGNLWTTYRFPIGLTVGGGVRYVGSSWLGRPDDAERIIPNGNAGELPSYTVVDAIVSYDFTPKIGARLNVRNLTDELYAISSNWAGSRVTLGAPRSFLLSADVRF